jgi:hypothetical protein
MHILLSAHPVQKYFKSSWLKNEELRQAACLIFNSQGSLTIYLLKGVKLNENYTDGIKGRLRIYTGW